jgi:hypothetical protein
MNSRSLNIHVFAAYWSTSNSDTAKIGAKAKLNINMKEFRIHGGKESFLDHPKFLFINIYIL